MDIEERLKSIKNDSNLSLHDHLLNVFGRLAETRPIDAIRSFEEVSEFVRETGYDYADGQNYLPADGRRDKGEDYSEFLLKSAKYWVGRVLPRDSSKNS